MLLILYTFEIFEYSFVLVYVDNNFKFLSRRHENLQNF